MSVAQGNKITAAVFANLKARVKAEMQRRGNTEGSGQNQSNGSMAGYAGWNYDYSVAASAGNKIMLEHITKITQCLDAVKRTNTTPSSGA